MKEFFTVIKVGLLNLKKYGIRDTARKSIGWLSCRNKSAIVEKVMPQHINCIQDFVSAIESCGGYVKGKDLENFSPFCLLISHELNHTGAPIALFNMALVLKDEGYAPIFISINDGDFAIDIASQGITVAYIPFKQLSQLLIIVLVLENAPFLLIQYEMHANGSACCLVLKVNSYYFVDVSLEIKWQLEICLFLEIRRFRFQKPLRLIQLLPK